MIRPSTVLMMLAGSLALSGTAIHGQGTQDDPYLTLRQAYAQGDPAKAASAYASEATYSEHYPGTTPIIRLGQPEIEQGFAKLFEQLGKPSAEYPITINFRFASRKASGNSSADTGFYRLTVGKGAAAQSYFGAFSTFVRGGQFVADTSSSATIEEFEGAAGPVAYAPDDEELAAAYYDRHIGTYSDGRCAVVVTRSAWRLFAYYECSGEWRGLNRVSGLQWTAGDTVIDPAGTISYTFDLTDGGKLKIGAATSRILTRQSAFKLEAVTFGDEPKLAGTLYIPENQTEKRPAVVMLHGSGPQDRNGYASIIALMAQRLARSGVVVLAFDKRGVGNSDGRWDSAGFGELAADAQAAMRYLATRPEVDPNRIGLAGSSQAGWVAAKAIADGAKPAFTMLVGAAGSALTVEEQNIYNSEILMQCAGLKPNEIRLALDQQKAFFAARRDPEKASVLASTSQRAQKLPALRDWLFPATPAPTAEPRWYDVLDTRFDPLPVWAAYPGKAYFLFGSQDDSTPTSLATKRLKSMAAAKVAVLNDAQHLGLKANSLCTNIETRQAFHPDFFSTLDRWAKGL
jgi:pimeloyl-ACP methyl ester carboxylesterase